jgi:hypothetical protein
MAAGSQLIISYGKVSVTRMETGDDVCHRRLTELLANSSSHRQMPMGSHEKVCLGRVCGNASPGFLPMADVITRAWRIAVALPKITVNISLLATCEVCNAITVTLHSAFRVLKSDTASPASTYPT